MRILTVSILIALICAMSCSTILFAQTRTTPVEVQNTPNVKVDPSGNTVKIDNTGNTVQVSGTPSVNVANTPNVNVGSLPAVKVDPAQNTVKIDSTQNTVKTPAMSNQLTLWTSQLLPHGNTISSGILSCTGYKELRIAATLPSATSDTSNIRINVRFMTPISGGYFLFGSGNFATPSTPLISYANFTQSSSVALMIVPVMSNYALIEIVNNRTTDVNIGEAWVYMVN